MEVSTESPQQQNTNIQQLSVHYHLEEDRLILKIGMANHYEIVVWLSRRVAKLLLSLLDKQPLKAPSKTKSIPSSKVTAAENTAPQKKLDFVTQYQPRKPAYPNKFFLVHQCQIEQLSAQNSQLELLCTNKKSLKLALNDELLEALIKMLELATRQANWDFSETSSLSSLNFDNTNRVLH